MAEKEVVLGLFTDVDHASMAVDELKMSGYDAKDISVIMREKEDAAKVRGEDAGSSAAKGAGTGAVIGGVAGLLIGLSAVAVPGVGPLIVGGPIAGWLGLTGAAAATVTGTVTGALAGGLIGGLIGLRMSQKSTRPR